MAAITTVLAVASGVATAAAATQQRREARRASREARELRAEGRMAQAAHEQEVEATKKRDEESAAMFEQRRRQRALASFSTGRRATSTTGMGIAGGFGPSPVKTAMGA